MSECEKPQRPGMLESEHDPSSALTSKPRFLRTSKLVEAKRRVELQDAASLLRQKVPSVLTALALVLPANLSSSTPIPLRPPSVPAGVPVHAGLREFHIRHGHRPQALADIVEAVLGAGIVLYGTPGAWWLARRLEVVPNTRPAEMLCLYCETVRQGASAAWPRAHA